MTAIEKHEAIYSVKLIYKSENSTFRERGWKPKDNSSSFLERG